MATKLLLLHRYNRLLDLNRQIYPKMWILEILNLFKTRGAQLVMEANRFIIPLQQPTLEFMHRSHRGVQVRIFKYQVTVTLAQSLIPITLIPWPLNREQNYRN